MKTITTLIFILALAVSHFAQFSAKKVPALELKDLKGRIVKLSNFNGKIVLLNFWAIWCGPCLAEIPELVKWHEKYKADGLQIIGITYPPTNLAYVRSFVGRKKMSYPVLLGSKATKRLFDDSDNLPITVIVDRMGNVVGRIDGVIFQDEFDAKVKPLLTP
ncbi:MAG: TlpA family protein disulfide reductase [Pyrinomonadaceae bacterium]